MNKHILSMLVSHQVGVLARITSVFNRKLLNIECMSIVGDNEAKRITVMVQGRAQDADLACKLISNNEDVFSIVQIPYDHIIEREIVLVKANTDNSTPATLIDLGKNFAIKLLRQTDNELVIEFIGSHGEVEEFLRHTQNLNPTEVSRANVCFAEIPNAGITVMVN